VPVHIRSASRVWRVAYENTVLQVLAKRRNLDCLHWFSATHAWLNSVPSAVTFYDLQAFRNLAGFPLAKRCYLRAAMRRAVRKAEVLLPISHATAAEMRGRLGASEGRTTVIPPVVPSTFREASRAKLAEFRSRYGLPEHYWLCVAHYYPHKNHGRLLRAYRRLRDGGSQAWPLVFRGDAMGAERVIDATVSELGLRDDVLQMRPLPRLEMPGLYAAASALVFPSIYEGGSIPILEAMACGCPVAASGIPVNREVAGEAALYFEPTDEASIAGAMLAMQGDAARRQQLREEGLTRSERFRPDAVAPRLTQAYRQAASIPRNQAWGRWR